MPSPRAVLADIHDLSLDPNKPHSKYRASGRLTKALHGTTVVEEAVKQSVVHHLDEIVEVVEVAPEHVVPEPEHVESEQVAVTEVSTKKQPKSQKKQKPAKEESSS